MQLQQMRHRLGHQARMKSCGNRGLSQRKVVCQGAGEPSSVWKDRDKGVSIKWRCPGHRSEACQCYTNEIWEKQI